MPETEHGRGLRAARFLQRIVNIRPGEAAATLCSFSFFFCVLCAYYLLRPLRDAMGLVGGAGKLPWLFTATFLTMLAAMPLFGMIATAWPPRRFVPWVYRFFAFNILAFAGLFAVQAYEVSVSRIFFVWISVFNLFVVSIFWSVMADHFSTEQGKRLFGFIAAGGTVGALLGPVIAAALAVKAGVAALAVLAAILLELAVQCFRRLERAATTVAGPAGTVSSTRRYDTHVGGGILSGLTLLARDRYLLGIASFLVLHTFASTMLYLEQGRIVAASFADTASRTQFFALVDAGASLLSLVLQLAVTGRLLQRTGIAPALMALPVVSLLAVAAIAIWPTAAVLGASQAIRRSLDYAIVRPARENLFIVVTRAAKYKAKSVIETVVYRGGDAVSSWLIAALSAAGLGFAGLAAVFAPVTAGWVWLSLWLERSRHARAERKANEHDSQEVKGRNEESIR